MHDPRVGPLPGKILRYQPAMTMLRRGLAAEQDRRHLEQPPIDCLLHLPLGEQGHKARRVFFPGDRLLFVGVEDLLAGREFRLMTILGLTDLPEEVLQIVALGESRKLRGVTQPHVDYPSDPGSLEDSEELGGAFLGKTDRVDFHASGSSMSNSVN